MVQYSHLFKNFPQFVVIHIVKGFSIVNEADVFLEFSCFLCDPTNVDNLISGSSAFSKSSLNIWEFKVHVLLKPVLLLERKTMTNVDSIFKSRDITLPTKVCLVKAFVYPVVMYGCESWTIKKAEC